MISEKGTGGHFLFKEVLLSPRSDREGENPKSEGMTVDLAVLSPTDWKKKGFYFCGQTQNTVIYSIIYAIESGEIYGFSVKKCSNWD